jgi:SAM-dependent methyltransferase
MDHIQEMVDGRSVTVGGPVIGDAFGELLRAAVDGQVALGAVERDDGLLSPHDGRTYLTSPDEWDELERIACARAIGRVVDVGCGAGRHSLHLQDQGYDVTAVDSSPGACEVTRRRGVRRVHEVALDQLPGLGQRFDTFLLLGNNLALLGSPERAPAILAALAGAAASGARILGGSIDPYVTDDPVHVAYHVRNRELGRPGGQTMLRTRFGRTADPWFDYLLCSRDELARLTEDSPWRLAGLDSDGPGYLADLRLR